VLASCLPSREDIAVVQNFIQNGGEESKLPQAEKFVLKLDAVPYYDERLKSFLFLLSFDSKKLDCDQGIQILRKAAKEILNSKLFPQLLNYILEVGNFINEGSPRGGGFGFKMSSLPKLEDIKTADNKTTLLQFILKILDKNAPELAKFYEELPTVEQASKVSLLNIISDIAGMKKDFEGSMHFMESIKLKEQIPILTNSMSKVKGSLEVTEKSFAELDEAYKSVVAYLGEDPKCPAEELFGSITLFIKVVVDANKRNIEVEAIAEKQKKREEARRGRMKKLSQSLEREAFEVIKQQQQKKMQIAEQSKSKN